jgi:HTH-type transcriptional regulator, cell division transcriptional repressor
MTTPHENLKREWQYRKKLLKLTQTKAASKIGWTQSAFSQYLNGTTKLNTPAILKLAKLLEIPPTVIDPALSQFTVKRCPNCNKELP